MAVRRLDDVLARSDPFDVAQAIESYVGALDADRLRGILLDAQERLGPYYRGELLRLLGANQFADLEDRRWSSQALCSALVHFLRSNLRAIPLFGSAFTAGIVELLPADRAVAIGEEAPRWNTAARAALAAGSALALVVMGAAGEHALTTMRAANETPAPGTPPVVAATTPRPHERLVAEPARPVRRVAVEPVAVPTSQPPKPPIVYGPLPSATPAASATPPPGGAAVTITAPPQAPTPEPTSIDVTDMPQAYSDATPMPQQSIDPATAPQGVEVPTPTPSPTPPPNWIHRTLQHLDPFKPGGSPSP